MSKYVVFLGLALCVWMCGSSEASSNQISKNTPPDGSRVFKVYCVTCHGAYGDMQANGAKDLTKSELSLDERILIITKGRNVMTPFENLLSEEKIRAVAEYTMTLKK